MSVSWFVYHHIEVNLNCSCIDVSEESLQDDTTVTIKHIISKAEHNEKQTEYLNTVIVSNDKIHDFHFEIVDKIPEGYKVFDLGRYMGTNDYIPLTPAGFIEVSKLKAIRLPKEEVMLLRKVAKYGITDLRSARMGSSDGTQLEGPQRNTVIKIFERISE